ncbi:MAG: phosphoenolpyruvate carboxylase, partial [Bacteroidetes bacterium]|nr:phosphoenolpyruvate carboxylase [Bacteroidota bacterium]
TAPLPALQQMYRHWNFFRAMVDNIQMIIAKADMEIAQMYAGLVEPDELRDRTFTALRGHFDRSTALLVRITGQRHLLDNNATLQRSILLRNPYVDPMSLIQVELLRRLRTSKLEEEQRKELEETMFLCINGIAAGLRNTG